MTEFHRIKQGQADGQTAALGGRGAKKPQSLIWFLYSTTGAVPRLRE